MPPVADAVCLVDRDEGWIEIPGHFLEPRVPEPLRRHVDQAVLARADAAKARAGLLLGERAREVGRGDAALGESGDLVQHQRDEGRDDERRPLEHRGRKLVDEALPTARRGDKQEAAVFEEGFEGLQLARAE